MTVVEPQPHAPRPAVGATARSVARLTAVQALYQHDMEGTAGAQLLHEFHRHRLAEGSGSPLASAEQPFFDDLVSGTLARLDELDAAITGRLASGWSLARLDRTMKALLRVGAYELIARPDVPTGVVINEYVEVAKAFFDAREAGFVNGLLDAIAKAVRG